MTNIERLNEFLKDYPDVVEVIEKDNLLRLKPTDKIKDVDLDKFANNLFMLEAELANKEHNNNITLDLKGLDLSIIQEFVKIGLRREDLSDPLMMLNIINLIKIYNVLNDNFLQSENVYFSDTEQILDTRLELREELEDFVQQLSIYFISLFKSYNKTTYVAQDTHKKLPKIFKNIFLMSDFLTLSGIFASSKPFSTDQCVYLEDAIECMYTLEQKSAIGYSLISDMIKGLSDGNSSGNSDKIQ